MSGENLRKTATCKASSASGTTTIMVEQLPKAGWKVIYAGGERKYDHGMRKQGTADEIVLRIQTCDRCVGQDTLWVKRECNVLSG